MKHKQLTLPFFRILGNNTGIRPQIYSRPASFKCFMNARPVWSRTLLRAHLTSWDKLNFYFTAVITFDLIICQKLKLSDKLFISKVTSSLQKSRNAGSWLKQYNRLPSKAITLITLCCMLVLRFNWIVIILIRFQFSCQISFQQSTFKGSSSFSKNFQ